METNPLVSFIVPFYNDAATIEQTIRSALKQSYSNFDVWIVDDGSTDAASLDILKKLADNPKIHVVHQENQGPSMARFTAINKTQAPFLVLLDSDNIIRENTLDIAIPVLVNNDHIAAVYGDLYYFGDGIIAEIKKQEEFSIKKALIYNQIDTASVIRKKAFDECGHFDEYMSKIGLEDWELWIRLTENGWTLKHVDHVLFDIKVRKDSRTFVTANPNLEKLKQYVYKKHIKTVIREYEKRYYEEKMLRETPDYRIGNFLMRPWRFIKQILIKKG